MIRPPHPPTPVRHQPLLRLMGAGLIVALGGGLLAAAPALAIAKPAGSHVQFLLDNRDPASATTSSTTWASHGMFVAPSTTAADFGCPTDDAIAWAITPASTDGSTEQPLIADGVPARDVYKWTPPTQETSLNYLPQAMVDVANNPAVEAPTVPIISTTYLYTKDQFESTVVNAGAQSGVRLRALWPSGTELSLVGFCAHNSDAAKQPVLSRGSDGRAISSWFHFRAVADGSFSSAAFALYDDKTATNVRLGGTATGTTGTLTATITGSTGTTTTDAAGTVSFYAGEDSTAPLLGTVTASAGVATWPLTGLTPGSSPTYSAVYTPSEAAGAVYLAATSSPFALIVPATPVETPTQAPTQTPTNPPVVTPPATDPPVQTPPVVIPAPATSTTTATIPATTYGKAVTAKIAVRTGASPAAGVVAMTIDKRLVRRVALTSGTSAVVIPATLLAGKHTLTVVYEGNATTKASSVVRVFSVGKAAPALTIKLSSAKAIVKKSALKATVTLVIPGSKTLPTGKVTIKVGSKIVKTVTVTAGYRGTFVVSLPKFTKTSKKVVVTASYAGTANVGAKTSAPVSVKVVKK